MQTGLVWIGSHWIGWWDGTSMGPNGRQLMAAAVEARNNITEISQSLALFIASKTT